MDLTCSQTPEILAAGIWVLLWPVLWPRISSHARKGAWEEKGKYWIIENITYYSLNQVLIPNLYIFKDVIKM